MNEDGNGSVRMACRLGIGSDKRPVIVASSSTGRVRAAMRASANGPESIVCSGEGHGWLMVGNRIDLRTRVEKFLAKKLN